MAFCSTLKLSIKESIQYIQQMLFTFSEAIIFILCSYLIRNFWFLTVVLRFPWDWDFPYLSIWPQNNPAPLLDVPTLFLFLNWWCYWSWLNVSNPIPFSRPCGQHCAIIWSDPEVYSEPWMDLCVALCSRRFWTIPSPAGFRGDTLVWLPPIWAAFDKALHWYCHDCCFCSSLNRHAPFESRTHTCANTLEHWSRHVNAYMSYTHTKPVHTIQPAHDSGSCSDRMGFSHFTSSRNFTHMHMRPVCTQTAGPFALILFCATPLAINQALQEPLCTTLGILIQYYSFCHKKTSTDVFWGLLIFWKPFVST